MGCVPELRFKEFNKDWEEKKLGTVLSSTLGGGTPSRKIEEYWEGSIPWATVKDLHGEKYKSSAMEFITKKGLNNSSSKLIPINSLIISTRMGLGKFFINKEEIAINQDLKGLIPNKNILIEFLYYIYQIASNYIESIGKGSTVKGIRLEELHNLRINIPSLEEQGKIANFLSKIDEKIAILEDKLQLWKTYKKGIMQQLFSQQLRFKDDEGNSYPDWEEKYLNQFVNRITRKNESLESNLPLTISAQFGLVDQGTFFNKKVASENLKGYYLILNGEFAYNKSYSKGFPFGTIKRLDNYDKGVLSTLYICFRPFDIVSDFLVQYFDSSYWHEQISLIAVEGARNHGLLNVSVNDFFKTKHIIPCFEEQKKIANFLNTINKKLEKIANELKSNEDFKKGVLQKMFC